MIAQNKSNKAIYCHIKKESELEQSKSSYSTLFRDILLEKAIDRVDFSTNFMFFKIKC